VCRVRIEKGVVLGMRAQCNKDPIFKEHPLSRSLNWPKKLVKNFFHNWMAMVPLRGEERRSLMCKVSQNVRLKPVLASH